MNSQVALGNLARSSALGAWISQLRGRSVLIATEDQFLAVLAMLELDGTARRIVLCPPDHESVLKSLDDVERQVQGLERGLASQVGKLETLQQRLHAVEALGASSQGAETVSPQPAR